MIDIDVTELADFFGVPPEPEPEEEREFFAAPLFVVRAGDLELSASISAHFDDVRLELRRDGREEPLLSYVMTQVQSVSIDRGQSDREWLRARSRTQGHIEISVYPTIEIRIDGSVSA